MNFRFFSKDTFKLPFIQLFLLRSIDSFLYEKDESDQFMLTNIQFLYYFTIINYSYYKDG